MGRYEFLEDVALADCAIEIEGQSLDDLFETAAVALAHLMVDPATLMISEERTVHLEAPEVDLLLYDWLSEMPGRWRSGRRPRLDEDRTPTLEAD
jgi:SHS2 domain-containing protein